MKALSGKAFGRILERNGWRLLRVSGSHHVYGKEGSTLRLSIPVHANRPLKRGLQLHLMKLAALTEDDVR